MCRLISWAALAMVVSQRTVESWPPQLLSCKESACNAGDAGNTGLIPGLGRSPGGEHGNLLQYSCLRSLEGYNPEGCKESDTTERLGTATVHLGQKSVITCLSNCSFIYSRPSTLYLSWEQMETDKIQELFFSETFFFFFFFNLALHLLKLGYLGHSKVTSFSERRQKLIQTRGKHNLPNIRFDNRSWLKMVSFIVWHFAW